VTFNHGVEGSSPSALTMQIKHLVRDRQATETARVGTVLANQLPPGAGSWSMVCAGIAAGVGNAGLAGLTDAFRAPSAGQTPQPVGTIVKEGD
jgi:hypothetical protein